MVEVEIYSTTRLRVHDTLEYEFEDLVKEFVYDEEAGGEEAKVRTLVWAQGIAMWITNIVNPTSEIVTDEVNGILHFQRVTYASKEKFEKRIVRGNVTINLLDQNEQPLYRDLAKKLKWYSQWKKGIRHVPESYGGDNYVAGDPVFVKDLEAIEKEYGIPSSEEFGFIAHRYKLGLSVQQTADLLKERKAKSEPNN